MYMLIAGNNNDPFNFSAMCRYKSYEMSDVEEFVDDNEHFLNMGICIVLDGEEGKVCRDYKVVDWKNRDNAKTVEEAAKVIANQLSELDIRNPNENSLREIEDYAKSKGVPFSATVHTQFLKNFVEENPMWDSSSAYC